MKVALVYDRINKWGGAERVLLALHKLFPNAPLYTSVYNSKTASWAKVFDVRTSFLQSLPFTTYHELFAALMPLAFESFSFDEFDLVISFTSEAAKGIITKPNTKHICYCLTPTRYLWSAYDEYFRSPFFRFFTKPVVFYLRAWDKIASQRPDVYIAISKEVQARIKRYYGRESVVVYPPIDNKIFNFQFSIFNENHKSQMSNKSQNSKFKIQNSDYFLIVSRLVPYKKIDIAISAFNKLRLPLKIVGVGSQEKYLKSISGQTIEFLGNLTEDELVSYYKGCRALIFPGIEDFGLTVLEAQSFGKPVITFRGGGALETVIEGKTGEFFYPQTVKALVKKVKEFISSKYDPLECMRNAERFSFERFEREFMRLIKEKTGGHK